MMKKLHMTNEDIADLCGSLVYLTSAGIGDGDALSLIAEDEDRPAYSELYGNMSDYIFGGGTLDGAFEDSGVFPSYVPAMIRVGMESGRVPDALTALERDASSRASTDKRLKSSLIYPAVLMLVMLIVMAVLLIYVLPVFDEIYARLGSGLTGVAAGLLSFGRMLKKCIAVPALLFAAAAVFLALFGGVASFREKILERRAVRRSGKGVYAKISAARFARGLDLAMNSGMGVSDGIALSAGLLGNDPSVKSGVEGCIAALEEGASTADALRCSGLLPAAQCRLLDAGIRGGEGENAIHTVADRLEEDSDAAIDDAIGRVEPAIVIVTALMVGMILLSVMLPLINVMSALG